MFGKCLWFLLQLQLTENKCHWNKCYQSVIQNQSKYCWGPANRSNALDWIRLDLPGLFQDCSLVMHVLAETVICCQFGPFIWSIMDSQSEQNAGDIPCSSFLVVWLFQGAYLLAQDLGGPSQKKMHCRVHKPLATPPSHMHDCLCSHLYSVRTGFNTFPNTVCFGFVSTALDHVVQCGVG